MALLLDGPCGEAKKKEGPSRATLRTYSEVLYNSPCLSQAAEKTREARAPEQLSVSETINHKALGPSRWA